MADKRTAVGAGYAALCLLIGIAGMALPRPEPPPRPDFRLTGWKPDPTLLAPALEQNRTLAEGHPWDEKRDQATLEAFYALGEAEAAARGNEENPAYRKAAEQAGRALNEYWFRHGKEGYLGLGVHLADRFVRSIHAVLTLADRAKMPVLQYLELHPEPAAALYRIAGDFVRNAVRWGLILPNNRVAGGTDHLLRIHFEVRWCQFVNEIMDYTLLMHPEKLRALWRWRLEGDVQLGLEQRRKVATWLMRFEPDYPVYATLASTLARRGQYRQAIPFAREALLDDVFDRRWRENLEFLLLAAKAVPEVHPRRP